MTLETVITFVLKNNTALSRTNIVRGVLSSGYKTKSKDFALTVHRMLSRMLKASKVKIVGDSGYPFYEPVYRGVK